MSNWKQNKRKVTDKRRKRARLWMTCARRAARRYYKGAAKTTWAVAT